VRKTQLPYALRILYRISETYLYFKNKTKEGQALNAGKQEVQPLNIIEEDTKSDVITKFLIMVKQNLIGNSFVNESVNKIFPHYSYKEYQTHVHKLIFLLREINEYGIPKKEAEKETEIEAQKEEKKK
jgi:hypothetical protein